MGIILASKSPRRRELLEKIGITDFKIFPAEDEDSPDSGLSPAETVKQIASGKARQVSEKYSDSLVIAADTLVYLDGEPLGKPEDEDDAMRMLRRLSGRTHDVYTGICVRLGEKMLCEAEQTRVTFRELTDYEIAVYVATGEPMDKAGAYGIQGRGAVLAERIDGDFFNVMGLPLCRLYKMLREFELTV